MAYTKEFLNALSIGTVVNGSAYSYTIRKVLGQGTFGITYLASVKMSGALGSLDTEVFVAIKEFFMKELNGREESTVTSSSKDGAFAYYKSKFIHEAENLSKLKHPNIIKVVESFEENNTAYYAMEYIEGGSLDDRIAKYNGLSELECINYACQIGKALEYMHSQQMLHLDLKPNNIMLHKNGQIVLIDFGLAKQFGKDGKPETSTTIGHGTPGYAPIEQANYRGDSGSMLPVTMDIYAFGATMFKMLTGHRPTEASSILNDGFPTDELRDKGSGDIIRLIHRCMEPLRKNRHQSMKDVIAALMSISKSEEDNNDDTSISKGYYKKAFGDRAYGTYEVKLLPVTDSIDMPCSIKIRLWDNSQKGKSYELYLTDIFPSDGDISLQNSVRIWDKGKVVKDDAYCYGIPDDVKEYIIEHGLLSTVHWENEESTSFIDDDFGTDVMIQMWTKNGESYTRKVAHAHKDYHSFLLDAVSNLVFSTSLAEVVAYTNNNNQKTNLHSFQMPSDIKSLSVRYQPPFAGRFKRNDGYWHKICVPGFNASRNSVVINNISTLIKEFNNLDIQVGKKITESKDYSEEPGELEIVIDSTSQGTINLSLVAFNTDMQGGNIYNAHISKLASSIDKIIVKFLPKEPTRELIYSIPDETSEIWISHTDAGAVGLVKPAILRIGKNKKSPLTSNTLYTSNPVEFVDLVNGLRHLQLRSQDEENIEPSTGVIFPRLTISLFDANGKRIKEIYAEDHDSKAIGNIVMPVEELKDKIAEISPSFKEIVEPKPDTLSNLIFRLIFFTVIIGILALPVYLFAKPEDDLYLWLWITIGSTELFSAVLFSLGGVVNKSSKLSTFETISFMVGCLCTIAYIVLWIFQMCYWWA